MCHKGYCNGADLHTVGRAAAEKVKEKEGQCVNNADVGTWFSFTASAQCTGEQQIASGECAWSEFSRSKTISMTCLQAYQIDDTCDRFLSLPYTRVASVRQVTIVFLL
jgi:hypothetical protein